MNPNADSSKFDQIDHSKNLSQLIRSNTPHYWNYLKNWTDLHGLQRYLPFEGMLAGDPHLGNFGVLPLNSVNGHGPRQMKFVSIDFDDAGRGPFVLDFIRYVIAVKSISSDVHKHPLEAAYRTGLAGKEMTPPKKIKHLLETTVSDYDDMARTHTEKDSSDHGFKLKDGEIEIYKAPIARSTIASLFTNETVIDLAIRPRARGGSASDLRIWVLVEDGSHLRRIMELKQYDKPATSYYQAQPPIPNWLSEIREVFWPGLDGSAYDLVNLAGGGWYWIREKRVSLFDVPYSSEKNKEVDFLLDLAAYDAYQLGLAHGRQSQSAAYRTIIEKAPDDFHLATESVEKTYLEAATKALVNSASDP
jgi:hypothetical protein